MEQSPQMAENKPQEKLTILSRKQAEFVGKLISRWRDTGVISLEQADVLRGSYDISKFNWRKLSKICLLVASICMFIALTSAFSSTLIAQVLAVVFLLPDFGQLLLASGAAILLFRYGLRRRAAKPERVYTNESIFFMGVLATSIAVSLFGKIMSSGSDHFSLLILLSAIIYGALGIALPSTQVWVFALLSLGAWMGAETGYMSGWGAYYLGMNYPLRFALFGALLLAASHFAGKERRARAIALPTQVMGYLYMFIALWIMSIFGNYNFSDYLEWKAARQIELFHWSLIFAAAAGAAVYHGLKCDDRVSYGFGITFLGINIYTRFFEYFWNALDKTIFFFLLGGSLWFIGSRAEKIWNYGSSKREI